MMSYLMMKKIKYLQLTEKIFQQKRLRAYVNVLINKATIRKEEQANAVDNVKSSDYYKLKSLIYSFKFFFIQTNDLCDLTTVLGLIFILRKLEIGFFGDLSDEAFERYALMSFIETALELIYTIITPYFIRRFTVYKQFYPSLGGQDTFFKNIVPFTGFVVFMFPLTFIKLLYEPQNQ
ncbi:UNKNOWN [Stylonychia lemnae]|uniref:Uncharacterized protein n=1 Tax=Stylonychia lemnae TaxID=5949 RepID=A0A078AMD2_STYLE|nr:UNKNOWN [Stylonychia lemnae]|eukprot:CDW83334.1 UNKNOWN [Stylonychia lemnae]